VKFNKKILVVGSYNLDISATTSRLPRLGETVIGETLIKGPGGKGANQAIGVARAGGDVTFAGCVGSDRFGADAVETLNQEGVNTDLLKVSEKSPTGTALILVTQAGENQIVVIPGANHDLLPEDIENLPFKSYSWLAIQLEVPIETVKRAVKLAYDAGVKVLLNPAPANQEIKSVLKYVHVISPNESEVEELTGINVRSEEDAQEAAEAFFELGVEEVIITMGGKGVFIASSINEQWLNGVIIPVEKVDVVDTTGAGDCFNSALATALSEGKNLEDAARFAVKAAGISVTKPGAASSMPYRHEINCGKGEY
jgi:ribokinase